MSGLILATNDARTALEHRAEEFHRGKLQAFAVIAMHAGDGRVTVDFSFEHASEEQLRYIGAGASQLVSRIREEMLGRTGDKTFRPIDNPFDG